MEVSAQNDGDQESSSHYVQKCFFEESIAIPLSVFSVK